MMTNLPNLVSRALLVCIVAVLPLNSGCDNGAENDDNSFALYPPGYFTEGFRQEFVMTGSAPSGLTTSGTHLLLTQASEVFNGQQTTAVRTQNDWTDSNGGSFSAGALDFYTTDAGSATLLGFRDLLSLIESTNTSPGTLPLSAEPGDSGSVGTFSDAGGNRATLTWELQDVSDSQARVVFSTTVRDALGAVVSEGEVAYVIDRDGRRSGVSILFDVKAFNDPVSWTGSPR